MRKLALTVPVMLLWVALTAGQTADQVTQTIEYLKSLEVPNGGFRPAAAQKGVDNVPTVASTNEGLRALKYFGGKVENKERHAKFIANQFDAAAGGFIDPASKKATVPMTVTGVLALSELGAPIDDFKDGVLFFLGKSAESFEEIRMAAAGLEELKPKQEPSYAKDWLDKVNKMRNAAGSWGQGDGVARDTGSAVALVLRLGGKIEKQDAVVQAMKGGQRSDGGFGQAESKTSDLGSCYRIVRSLRMLKEKPANVQGLRDFIARCRNTDAGYGVAPGQPSTISGTYFAGVMLYWLKE